MRHAALLVAAGWLLAGCPSQPWEAGAHLALTEREFYFEGRVYTEAKEVRTKVDGVTFTPVSTYAYAGWVQGKEVWAWDEWVNEEGRTDGELKELGRHEVCHLSKGTNHGEAWCGCMEGYLTPYCGRGK